MARDRYQKGSFIRVKGTFKDAVTKELVDPDLVTLTVLHPDKSSASLDYDRISLGVFEAILDLAQKGTYYWHWTGSIGASEKVVIPGSCDSYTEVEI